MATKVREIAQGADLPACDLRQGCSMHRRADCVYEDQLWSFALELGTGHSVHDPSRCCPTVGNRVRP
jgi:hypothetical protein